MSWRGIDYSRYPTYMFGKLSNYYRSSSPETRSQIAKYVRGLRSSNPAKYKFYSMYSTGQLNRGPRQSFVNQQNANAYVQDDISGNALGGSWLRRNWR